jgi:hypothetical protein
MPLVRVFVVRASLVLSAVLFACGTAPAQAPAGSGSDPVGVILASHKAIDDSYARAPMSPFTAVAVRYFEPGQTSRLGVTATGATFDATSVMADAITVTLEDGVFWVAPVAGSVTPVLLMTSGEGDVTGMPGTPVKARLKLAPRQVIGLGRYFVEFYARPDTGNARVFDPEAPMRKTFTGLKWYAPSVALMVKAAFTPAANPAKVIIMTSRGLQKEYFRVGTFGFVIEGKPQKLTALSVSATPANGEEFFMAFRDATTGVETYSVGRYLTVPVKTGSTDYVLDFNAVTNPLCNYSPHYNCPIPPRENVLTVAIRAGEMEYPKEH